MRSEWILSPQCILFCMVRLFGNSFGKMNVLDSITFEAKKNPFINRAPTYFDRHFTDTNSQSFPNEDNLKLCEGIVCFVYSQNGFSTFHCQENIYLYKRKNIIAILECSIWESPSSRWSQYANQFFDDSFRNVRVRVRPKNMEINGAQPAMQVDIAEQNALLNLCKVIQRGHPEAVIKLAIIKVQIRKLNYQNLALLFSQSVVTNLVLWNPEKLEETSLLHKKGNQISNNFIKISFYCESENDEPAFDRLWIPWHKWQFKFYQCKGKYDCHPWAIDQKVCQNRYSCPQVPQSVIIQTDRLQNGNKFILKNYVIQTISYKSCSTEGNINDPLGDLIYQQNYWQIPRTSKYYLYRKKSKQIQKPKKKASKFEDVLFNSQINHPNISNNSLLRGTAKVPPTSALTNKPIIHVPKKQQKLKVIENKNSLSSNTKKQSSIFNKIYKYKPLSYPSLVNESQQTENPPVRESLTHLRPINLSNTDFSRKSVLNNSLQRLSIQSCKNQKNEINQTAERNLFMGVLIALFLINVLTICCFTVFYMKMVKKWKQKKELTDARKSKASKLTPKKHDWMFYSGASNYGVVSDSTTTTTDYEQDFDYMDTTLSKDILTSFDKNLPFYKTISKSPRLSRLLPKAILNSRIRPHTFVVSMKRSSSHDDKRSRNFNDLTVSYI